MTLHLIETLETSIHNPKHTKSTKKFNLFNKKETNLSKFDISSKIVSLRKPPFYTDLFSTLYISC